MNDFVALDTPPIFMQGRCWDTSRRARESISRPEQARVGHHQGHFRDGASGAVGVVGAAEIVHYVWLDRATVRHSALFLAELGRGGLRKRAPRQNRKPSDTAAGAPFGRPRCGRLPSLRSAWRQNADGQTQRPRQIGGLGGTWRCQRG